MARIRKRGETYTITVSAGYDLNGKQITQNTTYRPESKGPKAIEREVAAFAHEFEKAVHEGGYLDGGKITLAEYTETWRREWGENHLTPAVLEKYLYMLDLYIPASVRNTKLEKLKPAQIQAVLTGMQERGLAVKTIRYAFTCLNSVLKYAFKMQMIRENPCCRCELPRKQAKIERIQYFTREQAQRFLRSLDDEYTITYPERHRKNKRNGETLTIAPYTITRRTPLQFKVYFYLALLGGFRRGEMCALTWEAIDFKKQTISIKQARTKTKARGEYTKTPKTASSVRTLTMPGICFDLLKELKQEQMRAALCSSDWTGYRGADYDKNFIFTQRNGNAINLDTPYRRMQEALENYNATAPEEDRLPMICLHDLRHTSATLLLSEGVDIRTVANRLGHSQTSTTLNVYAHALPAADERAARVLSERLADGLKG